MKKLLRVAACLSLGALIACGGGSGKSTPSLVSLAIAPANPDIFLGQSKQLALIGTYSDSSTQNLTASASWSSSAQNVATINTGGMANSVATGSTTISASASGLSTSTTLTVSAAAVVSIALTPPSAQTPAQFTQQYKATATFTDGSTADITAAATTTWSSSDTSVATVANSGLATGLKAGAANITATSSNGTSGSVMSSPTTLTVTSAKLVKTSVTPADASLLQGYLQPMTAIGTFDDGTTLDITQQVTWASSQPATASISAVGIAAGVNASTTPVSISATSKDGQMIVGSTQLTVGAPALVSIMVANKGPVFYLQPKFFQPYGVMNTSDQYAATAVFSNGSTQDITSQVTWAIDNTSVATVSTTGLVKYLALGSAALSATLNGTTGSVEVGVLAPTTTQSVSVAPFSLTLAPATQANLTAIGVFTYSTASPEPRYLNRDAVWTSENPAVATVSSGIVTAVGPGTTNIDATFDAITAKAAVTVSSATLSGITVTPGNTLLAPGTTASFKATGTFSDGTTQDISSLVSWSTSDSSTATITTSGVATALQAGQVAVTASWNSVSGNSSLVVEGNPLVSITLTPVAPFQGSFPEGFNAPLQAIGTFSDGSTQNLTKAVSWASTITTVATVDEAGHVGSRGSTTGTTNINAVFGGQAATMPVNVTNDTLTAINVTPTSATIAAGQTMSFSALGTFTNNINLDLTDLAVWQSSAFSAVVIDSNGLATALGSSQSANVLSFLYVGFVPLDSNIVPVTVH